MLNNHIEVRLITTMASPLNVSSLLESVDDPPVDFMSLSVLSRPSDHFTISTERRSTSSSMTNSTTGATANSGSSTISANPYQPPPRRKHLTPHQFASRFIQDPVSTTISSFSKVANFILASNEDYESAIDELYSSKTEARQQQQQQQQEPTHVLEPYCPPPPALPIITCSNPLPRLEKLTEVEFAEKFANSSTNDILNRVFRGGIADYSLKCKLWPLILGLTDDWKKFDWQPKEAIFTHYFNQWQSILPDQESRFTAYRERKSIAGKIYLFLSLFFPLLFSHFINYIKFCSFLSFYFFT